jgi:hypothetical protein
VSHEAVSSETVSHETIPPGRHAAGRPRSSFVYTNRMAGRSVLPPSTARPDIALLYNPKRICLRTALRGRSLFAGGPLLSEAPILAGGGRPGSPPWEQSPASRHPVPQGASPGLGSLYAGPYAPARPAGACEAAWSPVPPFKGRSDRLHSREAAEAALGGRRSGDLSSWLAPRAPPRSSRLAALCLSPNAPVPP